MKPFARHIAIALLVLIGCGVAYMGFLYTRLLLVGLPVRVIVIPTDYEGMIYVLEDRVNGESIPVDGFWSQTATIRIPSTGILTVKDKTPLHWITKEKVMLTDGTIIDGTGQWFQRPSRFRHLGGSYRGGLPKGHPLETYRNPDGSIEYSAMEVSKTPQFDYLQEQKSNRTAQPKAHQTATDSSKGLPLNDVVVSSEQTAIQIAVAAWTPIYGKDNIERQKPYKAWLKDGIWHVTGSLPENSIGGVAIAEIRKSDAKIIRISHGK